MRKISEDSVNAFLNKQLFSRENMRVVSGGGEWYLLLHGNSIAKMLPDGTIYISTCGWHTRTTLDRLNYLLYTLGSVSRLRLKKGNAVLETKDGLFPWSDDFMVRYKLNTTLY